MSSVDIYTILSSKPHNKHYLQRYIKYIQNCKLPTEPTKTQNHHICPKAKDLFPEYENFKQNPWNKIKLTLRQHFIAHILLWKAFGKSQLSAAYQMMYKNGEKINSKLFEKLKIEAIELNASKIRGICTLYDEFGNSYKIKSAERHLYPNLKGNRANKVTVLDKQGNSLTVTTNDPRYLSGELVSILVGTKPKQTKRKKIYQN